MAGKHRLDQFKGTRSEYVSYLERQLTEARCLVSHLKSTPCPLEPHPSHGSPNLLPDDSTNSSKNNVANIPQDSPASPGASDLPAKSELKVIPYNVARVKPRKESPPWRQELRCFMSNIPVASLWPTKREEIQMSSENINQQALIVLLSESWDFGLPGDILSPLCPPPDRDVILRSLSAYARKIKTSRPLAKSIVQLIRFLDVVFVSLCKVALQLGHPITVIHEKMAEGFASQHPNSLDRLLRGAIWANKCISMLFDNGWNHRSTETFLLFGGTLELYGRLSDYKESTTLLKQHLTAPEYRMSLNEACGPIPYSIPSIIKVLIRDALTLSQICTYLGYSKAYSDSIVDLPDIYHSLLKEGVPSRTLVSNKRRRLIMDEEGLSSPLAENPPLLLESPLFDMSSMVDLGFDIGQMLEVGVDMSTVIQQGYSDTGLPTSTELVAAQSH